MTAFLVKRIGILIVSFLVASIIVFLVLNLLPGSPAQAILGTQSTPAAVKALNAQLGLNKPLWHQYVDWLGGVSHFSFGKSYISQQPIGPQITQALKVSGPLIGMALVIGLIVALPLGVWGALKSGRASGAMLGALSQIGIAIPTVVAGILLIAAFAVKSHIFPASGFPGWSNPGSALKYLVLPAVSLGVIEGSILSRYVRAAVADQLRSDYLRTARAKGLTRSQALWRHGLRNAMVPLVTVLGLELGGLVVGAIIVESVFDLPGLGTVLVSSVNNRDLLTVQDVSMLVAAVVLVLALLVDISYRVLDPRLRSSL